METTALDVLHRLLFGQGVCAFRLGDTWALEFWNGAFVHAHEIVSSQDKALAGVLAAVEPSVLDGLDTECIPALIVLMRCFQQPVKDVRLHRDGRLELVFEGERSLVCRSDVSIVDWQWSVGSGVACNPYIGGDVACFAADDVRVWGEAEGRWTFAAT